MEKEEFLKKELIFLNKNTEKLEWKFLRKLREFVKINKLFQFRISKIFLERRGKKDSSNKMLLASIYGKRLLCLLNILIIL